MAKTKISVENFRDFYLKQNKPRSIRRLHTELKEKFKGKLPSLATLFRHSPKWKQMTIDVDNRSSAIAMDKIVEKKAVQLTEITEQLKETSDKALQIVLQNLKNVTNVSKVQDLVGLNRIAVESSKLANLFSGNATSISSAYVSDSNDIVSLKAHIKELYNSIENDISKQQQPTNLKLVKETKH